MRLVCISMALISISTSLAVAQDSGSSLRKAVAADDAVAVAKLATSKAAVNAANSEGVTALMIASANGQLSTVTTLIKRGADVNAKTSAQQVSALMFAALLGRLDVAQALVGAGANIMAADKDQNTAIDYSILAFKDQSKEQKDRAVAVGKFLQSKGAKLKLTSDNPIGLLLSASSGDNALALLERAKSEK